MPLAQLNPLAPLYSPQFVLLLAAAWLYYKAAEFDNTPRWLYPAISLATSYLTWQFLHWSILPSLLAQLALAILIAIARTLHDRPT